MKENTVKAQVHMLPTDKASRIKYIPIGEYDDEVKDYIKSSKLLLVEKTTEFGYGGVHLYFTSSEEIKEGDWVLAKDLDGKYYPYHCDLVKGGYCYTVNEKEGDYGVFTYSCKKVVATTNPELYKGGVCTNTMTGEKSIIIAQVPTSFLQPYIDAYNAGTPITEVLLETETISTTELYKGREYNDCEAKRPNGNRSFYMKPDTQLKLRADNSVIIHPVKERMYTRAEVIAFGAWYSGMALPKVEIQLDRYHTENP